jgi:hypothetical protein
VPKAPEPGLDWHTFGTDNRAAMLCPGSGPDSQEGNGRGERIRTSGLYVPNVALYQAKLHPEDETGACIAPVETSTAESELPLDGKVRQL